MTPTSDEGHEGMFPPSHVELSCDCVAPAPTQVAARIGVINVNERSPRMQAKCGAARPAVGTDTMLPMQQPTPPHARADGPYLSLVIPAYNEAEVIPTL